MSHPFTVTASCTVLLAAAGFAADAPAAIVSYSLNTTISSGVSWGINMETGNVHLGELTGDDVFLLAGSSLFVFEQSVSPASLLARLTGTAAPSSLPLGFVIGATMNGAGWGAGSAVSFSTGAAGAFVRNAPNYVGVRFANSAGAYRNGYLTLQPGATNSQCMVTGIAYEDSGGAITVVPAPGALFGAVIAFAFPTRRRRVL